MSAELKLYEDKGTTNEIRVSGDFYDMFIGPVTGLDGDSGDQTDCLVYLKNVGTSTAYSVTLVYENNPSSLIMASLDNNNYSSQSLLIGDLVCEDKTNGVTANVVPIYLRIVVPSGTLMPTDRPIVSFTYKSE